jgi:uncharacterized RDD family membrane protein YckC
MTTGLPDPDYDAVFYDGVPAKRLIAWVIDSVIVLAASFVLALLSVGLLFFVFFALVFVVNATYRWITVAQGSATFGMRVMALELRGPDGARLDGALAAWHTGLFILASMFVIPQVISMVLIATQPRRQGLHDLFLGTAAINRPG